jgi:site-specific DNA recombinase
LRSGGRRLQPDTANADAPVHARTARCAIYTRKSTDEGLAQEFNSLDAQREAAEAYIASQKHEGWTLVPNAYNDGGFTGANMDRPALKRLLADIDDGLVDCVVVYKVDRLSRSLLDFARIMETFEKRGVSFVSVTQQLNSSSSMGRLTLNVLLSFAQFEREMIAERTRDKMSAARRKGKWVGGIPVLGYDVDPRGGRLVVNPDEAGQVQAIFKLYVECRSLIPAVRELNRRGWTTKQWTTRDGREHKGEQFTKNALYRLLTNVIYTGQVNHKGTLYPGEHAQIVEAALWDQVQERLRGNGVDGGREVRNRYGALLRGLLHCDACECAMVHTYTLKRSRRYRYYVCLTAQQKGWDACPTKSVASQSIEDSVVGRIRGLGSDPRVILEAARQVRERIESSSRELAVELKIAQKNLGRLQGELIKLVGMAGNGSRTDRMADLQEQIRAAERRAGEIRAELDALAAETVDEDDLRNALQSFDPVWRSLNTAEQTRLIRAVIDRIGYDGRTGKIAVTFRAAGFKAICVAAAQEVAA